MGLFDFFKKSDNANKNEAPAEEQKPAEIKSKHSKEELYGLATLLGFRDEKWMQAIAGYIVLGGQGLDEANFALGQIYSINQKEKALVEYKKAVDKGHAEAAWKYAEMIGHSENYDIEGADKEWYDNCLKAAQNGSKNAMNALGEMYEAKGDYLAAYFWLQMAGHYGYPKAASHSIEVVKKWGEAGHPELASSIDGVCQANVNSATTVMRCMSGEEKLTNEMLKDFMSVAMDEDNEFMGLFLGQFYTSILKVQDNAFMGYQFAAYNDSIIGMRHLADRHMIGLGCRADEEAAQGWYETAAAKREAKACFMMGEFAREENKLMAAYWYGLACHRGYDEALKKIKEL